MASSATRGVPSRGAWTSGLCDCFHDVGNCCITCWCPCITFGQIAEIIDEGEIPAGTSAALYALFKALCGYSCILTTIYRIRLREEYQLPESPSSDYCLHCCCDYCALCQEYRELKNRGYDMKIGWQANIARQANRVTAPPVLGSGMTR